MTGTKLSIGVGEAEDFRPVVILTVRDGLIDMGPESARDVARLLMQAATIVDRQRVMAPASGTEAGGQDRRAWCEAREPARTP